MTKQHSPGTCFIVQFALGEAVVKLLDYKHRTYDGETVYHVQDAKTGHQDFVCEKWLTPICKGRNK